MESATVGRWGHIEICGHRSYYAFVSEVTRFGVPLMLVQVPDVSRESGWIAEHEYGGSALFGFHVLTEQEVRAKLKAQAFAFGETYPMLPQVGQTEKDPARDWPDDEEQAGEERPI